MKIAELQPKQGNVDIEVEVVEKGDIREFEKFGRSGRVCNAKAKDDSGEIKLSLWNEQIDQVQPGAKVKITNGYVNEWQGEKQLTTGKFGQLEILEEGSAPAETPDEASEEAPEQPDVEEEKVE